MQFTYLCVLFATINKWEYPEVNSVYLICGCSSRLQFFFNCGGGGGF